MFIFLEVKSISFYFVIYYFNRHIVELQLELKQADEKIQQLKIELDQRFNLFLLIYFIIF